MSEKADIDFVILWVDDQDPIWIEDKNKYKGQQGNHTNNEVRYRDWQNLKYWFRAGILCKLSSITCELNVGKYFSSI